MTREHDRYEGSRAHGRVTARWTPVDGNGPDIPAGEAHNAMTYAAADALAAAYGGDLSLVPKYIGFIYGPWTGTPQALAPVDRSATMKTVGSIAKDLRGNLQVSRFSRPPTVGDYSVFGLPPDPCPEDSSGAYDSCDSNDRPYSANTVEFHAVTRSSAEGFYEEDWSDSDFGDNDAVYRAVLLGDGPDPCGQEPYTVLAMVDLALANGAYRQKPEGYELALDWRVTFE